MVPQAIFFVALASILIRIIMVYKNYMIIVLPLLDFIMDIWSQLNVDKVKRTKTSRVDGGRQLTMTIHQTMDNEEAENSGTVDEQQLIISMTSRPKMDQEE
jgi:hypothetical protein